MSDLYNIPHDDGKTYRLRKFVEYQHEVPSIHYRFLGEVIKKRNTPKDEAVVLAWILSLTYNEITALLISEMAQRKSLEQIWSEEKPKLQFGSAKKYTKNRDEFVPLMLDFRTLTQCTYYRWLLSCQRASGEETYKTIQKQLRTLNACGRFTSDIFLETSTYLKDYFGLRINEPAAIDWKNCANLTSGIFNIFYEDEKANQYDKKKDLTNKDIQFLTEKLVVIQNAIKNTYPEQDAEISMFIGKICSFRNLFKNARYGGFHHDRQLGVIKKYEEDYPEYKYLWEECYNTRKRIFPNHLLGELNGWDGIRKERKKLWLTTGMTGVER